MAEFKGIAKIPDSPTTRHAVAEIPKPFEGTFESPALEAERLVNGDRGSDYGHPLDDFTKTAKLWSVVLNAPVTPEQVALCMLQVKVSRQLNKNKRDNLVDIIGYTLTLDKVINERKRRQDLEPKLDRGDM